MVPVHDMHGDSWPEVCRFEMSGIEQPFRTAFSNSLFVRFLMLARSSLAAPRAAVSSLAAVSKPREGLVLPSRGLLDPSCSPQSALEAVPRAPGALLEPSRGPQSVLGAVRGLLERSCSRSFRGLPERSWSRSEGYRSALEAAPGAPRALRQPF